MKHSSFKQPLAEDYCRSLRTANRNNTEKPAVGFEIFNPAPAGGVSSTASDMGRFAQALLNGGEWEGHRILKPETLSSMWTKQFGTSDALPAMCMGFTRLGGTGCGSSGTVATSSLFTAYFSLSPRKNW